MKASSRFVVATHILTGLAFFRYATGQYQAFKSESLAWSVNTNAVVIRRVVRLLKLAELVSSKTGPDGGTMLEKNPEMITLKDVYEAVAGDGILQMHYKQSNEACPIGYHIQDVDTNFVTGRRRFSRMNLLA